MGKNLWLKGISLMVLTLFIEAHQSDSNGLIEIKNMHAKHLVKKENFNESILNPKTEAFNNQGKALLLRSYIYAINDNGVEGSEIKIGSSKNCKWSVVSQSNTIYCLDTEKNRLESIVLNRDASDVIKRSFYDIYDKDHQPIDTIPYPMTIGSSEGNLANEDRYLLLSGGESTAGSKLHLYLFDKSKREVNELDLSGTLLADLKSPSLSHQGWVSISPSGKRIVANQRGAFDADQQLVRKHRVIIYSLNDDGTIDKNSQRVIESSGHGDMVATANGEYYIQFEQHDDPEDKEFDGVVMYNLDNIEERYELFDYNGGGHISCLKDGSDQCFVIYKEFKDENKERSSRVYSFYVDEALNQRDISLGQPLVNIPPNSQCKESIGKYDDFRASPSQDGSQIIFQTTYDLKKFQEDASMACLGQDENNKTLYALYIVDMKGEGQGGDEIDNNPKEDLLLDSTWRTFGETWGTQAIYSRFHCDEEYLYIATASANSGSYASFPTEVGKRYEVSAELIGADVSRNERFEAHSYLTISSEKPTKEGSSVIASSDKVAGCNKVKKVFTFVATSTTSYLSIRSDANWHYASVRNLSVKEIKENPVPSHDYGKGGEAKVEISVYSKDNNAVIYHPDTWEDTPTPVIFFTPGFQNRDHTKYQSLLTFMASYGYSVLYVPDTSSYDRQLNKMDAMVSEFSNKLDRDNMGVIGHSSGGGFTFKVLDYFSKKGYGEQGRFLMALDPWFAFGMNSDAMRKLPENTNVVIQRYDDPEHKNETDARITLSEYALLDSIPKDQKDYQVYSPATHGYPSGQKEFMQMQGLLKPLDALMAYTFKKDQDAHDVALENGSDEPYRDGVEEVRAKSRYPYRCDSHVNRAEIMEIDYCHQYLGGKVYPSDTIFDDRENADVVKPDYLSGYVDPIFKNSVTRITDRSKQSANAHPYPKTEAWNADSTLIRLGYRLYDADNFSERAITENQHIKGSLTEMKWSTWEPDVFYGIDNQAEHFVFTRAVIDEEQKSIEYIEDKNASFLKSEYAELTLGKYEGNLDYQERYVLFAGRKRGSNRVTLILYHIQDLYGHLMHKIVAQKDTDLKWYREDNEGHFTTNGGEFNQMFDWATVSPKANSILVNYRSKLGEKEQEYSIEQYDMHLNHLRRLAEHGNHGDLGLDENGQEVYVQFGFGVLNKKSNLGIWSYPLDGSPRLQLLPDKYNGGHVSCRNYKRVGWCYVNTRYLWRGYGVREVFALKLDGSGRVERFAQTHNSLQNAGCTQVNVSPDGTRVVFASDWNEGSVEDYEWDKEHNKGCNDPTRKVKIDTYHVKVGE